VSEWRERLEYHRLACMRGLAATAACVAVLGLGATQLIEPVPAAAATADSTPLVVRAPEEPTTTVAPTTTAPAQIGSGHSYGCHPSYRGACVPYATDVDCIGGTNDGPAYVGPVKVVGPDEYQLDYDGDGNACEMVSR
jgi:hypothetical protein